MPAKVRHYAAHSRNNTSVWERGHKDRHNKKCLFQRSHTIRQSKCVQNRRILQSKYIWTVFDVRKGFRKKCTFICEASNRLTKNKCRLQREVHRTLEIAQTLMQRVVLLCSYAIVAKKGRPTNFLKLEFDKIAPKNIRFSRNRC